MQKFFKGIWQKLIVEGQLRNYIASAVNEIVLIVLGVLIAVQMDNWNEIVTDRAQREQYLQEIKENMQTDVSHLNDIVKWNADIIENVDSVFHILQHTTIADKMFLKIIDYEPAIVSQYDFHPEKAGFRSLISSVDPDLLQDHELIQQIENHYDYIEQKSNLTSQILLDIEINRLEPTFMDLYTRKEFLEALGYDLPTPQLSEADLSQNTTLIGALLQKKVQTMRSTAEAEDFIEKSNLLMEAIDNYIQEL